MASAAVDTSLLSSYTSIPEPTIHSLISQPTAELVTSFLRTLVSKAQEHNQLQSERLRLDVELENAVRGADEKARALKANTDAAIRETASLRSQLDGEGS